MCGIAGCYGAHDIQTIDRMLDELPHRGPDDRGTHVLGRSVLGHTRLSIVDVAKGHQPILTEDGSAGIICNGEIYNFQAIQDRLAPRHRFATQSDSEAILHLYREKGPDCVCDLDGMFAFAIADGDHILLARDPVGIKPLYTGTRDGVLYFSSELGAMGRAGIDDIREFPAGHYFTPAEGLVRYYDVPRVQDYFVTDVDHAAALVREYLRQAVKKRLLSDRDIHVGAFCSGGLDSSLVAAIAAEEIPHLHTFVVGMQESGGDESDDLKASRMAAAHIGSNHHELIFTESDYYDALPRVIRKLETYDPSLVRCAVPCYFTCKVAADYVTVVLTGEGADEVFAGYQYMKHLPPEKLNAEARRLLTGVHNINLQRSDRMGMLFSLELRVPFFDRALIDLGMKLSPELKIRAHQGRRVEKWILRKAFEGTGLLPDDILWRTKVQYTQGAGCEHLGERLAESELSDDDVERIRAENPEAVINSKEAAYYYTVFQKYHPQKSILRSIGIWSGFDFEEERARVRGSIAEASTAAP